jgi:hypothetical protein
MDRDSLLTHLLIVENVDTQTLADAFDENLCLKTFTEIKDDENRPVIARCCCQQVA